MKVFFTFLNIFIFIFVSFSQDIKENEDLKSGEYPYNSVLASGDWYKLSVNETGIYKITGADLIKWGISSTSTEINSIAIYGNKSGMVPENNATTWDTDLKEIAIYVEDRNGNGYFDEDDYILFYGESPNIWEYNSQSGIKFDYKIHHYASANFYFLTIVNDKQNESRRVKTVSYNSLTPNNETSIFLDYYVHEKELVNPLNSGRQWLGEYIARNKVSTFSFSIPNKVVDSLINYEIIVAAGSPYSSLDLKINGTNNYVISFDSFGGYDRYGLKTVERNVQTQTPNLDFSLMHNSNVQKDSAWLKKITFTAWRHLKFEGGQMKFRNPYVIGEGNITKFNIQGNSNNIHLWDITDPFNSVSVEIVNSGQFTMPTDSLKEFIVFDNSDFLAPVFQEKIVNQNLHGLPLTEYIIVAHPSFLSEAERLAQIHREYNNLHTTVVTPGQIYNEFSSGKQDPMAIRKLAKMFYDRVNELSESEREDVNNIKYLLLFGDGHFDNKNIKNTNPCFIVTSQSENSNSEKNSIVEDQMFGFLEEENGSTKDVINIGIGRFTVNDNNEAKVFVDKVENYILRKDLTLVSNSGDWRNYVCIVTDDFDEREIHFVKYAESLANKLREESPVFNIDNIYADAYRQRTGSAGAYYPDANNAIKKRMESGAIVLSYIGHGADSHLGVEQYISANDILSYTNKYKLPLVVGSTCDFGKFDKITDKSGTENFILNANGGAIAVIAPARKVSSHEGFNTKLISLALKRNDGVQLSLGDALREAKNAFPNSLDLRSINLIGDPALKLSLPENKIQITKINASEVKSDTNNFEISDTIKALSTITLEGKITDNKGVLIPDFNGILYVTIFDKIDSMRTLANDVSGTDTPFVQQKNRIYQGTSQVTNGEFNLSFMVPLCIKYNFDYGKISLYAQGSYDNASGYFDKIIIGGMSDEIIFSGKESSPEIKLFLNDTTFRSGGITDKNPKIIAQLSDENGINFSGGCIGKSIEAWIDNNTQEIFVLNDFYEQDPYDMERGTVNYPLSNISPGKHTLTLKASNIFNVTSEAIIEFTVDSSKTFDVGKVYNFPNPFTESTTFVCEVNNKEKLTSVEIQIFDVNGSLVKKIYPKINEETYSVTALWNGKTDRGEKIRHGVYLYRFVIITESGEKKIASNKMIIF